MSRGAISCLLGSLAGAFCFRRFPFPWEDTLLRMIWSRDPAVFTCLRASWGVMMFTTPWVFSLAVSFAFVFAPSRSKGKAGVP